MRHLSQWIFPFIVAAFMVDSLSMRMPQLCYWLCRQEWFVTLLLGRS